MRRLWFLSLLALAACQAQTSKHQTPPPQAPAAPPAPAPDLTRDLDVFGTEPFWSIKVRGETLVLSRPAEPDVTARVEAEAVERDRASWRGRTAAGVPMTLSLRREDCSDGMSDRSYAFAAAATLGRETLNGCAAPLSAGADSPP